MQYIQDVQDIQTIQKWNTDAAYIAPSPTLADIFAAVTKCNVSIISLTQGLHSIGEDIQILCQDAQKLQECTTTMEER